ncbi:MAG: hypothetical protein WDA42_03630 [Candidatus Bathyarchaeia archaeon]
MEMLGLQDLENMTFSEIVARNAQIRFSLHDYEFEMCVENAAEDDVYDYRVLIYLRWTTNTPIVEYGITAQANDLFGYDYTSEAQDAALSNLP